MTATVTTAEAISGLLALFLVIVGIVTLARVVLKREDATWRRMRVGFFVERDRSTHERELEEYDWDPEPPRRKD